MFFLGILYQTPSGTFVIEQEHVIMLPMVDPTLDLIGQTAGNATNLIHARRRAGWFAFGFLWKITD